MIGAMRANPITTRLLLTVIAMALVTACGSGSRQVRGELPLVTLDALERQGERITLFVGLRNINDGPLPLGEVEVRLRIDGVGLVSVVQAPEIEIGPRGREVLTLRGRGDAEGLTVLDRLDPRSAGANGPSALNNLSWHMELRLADERGRSRTAEISGFLHPVPGQPGRFR